MNSADSNRTYDPVTPEEFNHRWEQVLPIIKEIVSSVLINTPAQDSSSRLDHCERKEALADAYETIRGMLDLRDLKLFDQRPAYLSCVNNEDELLDFLRRATFYESGKDEATAAQAMNNWNMPIMRINAPAWFKNPEFRKWLKATGTATWHRGSDEPGEYSDVFFTFCGCGGSDYPGNPERPGIPDEIWHHLEFMVAEKHGWDAEVLLWVSNLED